MTWDIHEERAHAMAWLSQYALPSWATVGYDASACLFHERLTLDGRPLARLPWQHDLHRRACQYVVSFVPALSETNRIFGSNQSPQRRSFAFRRRALFVDRDGVLNHDIGYPIRPADIHWIEGASEAIRMANNAGYAVVVVS